MADLKHKLCLTTKNRSRKVQFVFINDTIMGLVHTPRVIAAICRGLWKKRQHQRIPPLGSLRSKNAEELRLSLNSAKPEPISQHKNEKENELAGFGLQNPYIAKYRTGMLDVDYQGHMNNAAYLTTAELARWEWTAYNGMMKVMYEQRIGFMLAGMALRYRREIRPLFRRYQIESSIVALDDRNMWMLQNFRYPDTGRNLVRAILLAQGVIVQDRKVIDPRKFFQEAMQVHATAVDSLSLPRTQSNVAVEEMLDRYAALQESVRGVAATDDEFHHGL